MGTAQTLAEIILTAYQVAAKEAALSDDPDNWDALKEEIHWNPEHMARAYTRHPELFDGSAPCDLLHLLAAFKCGAVKDDDTAAQLYDEWAGTSAYSLDWLKGRIKEIKGGKRNPPPLRRLVDVARTWTKPSDARRIRELCNVPEFAREWEKAK